MSPDRRRCAATFALVFLYVAATVAARALTANEYEKLPLARQAVDPDWIPGDWYLNLSIGYRRLFGWIAGPLCVWLDFATAARVLRVAIGGVFALGVARIARVFGLGAWVALPWVAIYLTSQSMLAGEWMLGSAETKGFAYACVVMALPAAYTRRYTELLAWLGLALSFHVLIGIYAAGSFLPLLLTREYRAAWPTLLRRSWVFAGTGAFGIFAIVQQLGRMSELEPEAARQIAAFHVIHRIPHHTLPSAWGSPARWAPEVLAWTAVLLVFALGRDARTRMLARYGLSSLVFFAIGLGIDAAGATHLLEYYWFRYPVLMVPLCGSLCLALVASDLRAGRPAAGLPRRLRLPPVARRAVGAALALACAALLARAVVPWTLRESLLLGPVELVPAPEEAPRTHGRRAMQWIRENTPRDARFLVDPTMTPFYVYAQRAVFVTWKHAPQSEPDFLDWWNRLHLLNGGPIVGRGMHYGGMALSSAYAEMPPDRMRRLAERFDLDYALTRRPGLPFRELFRSGSWAVVALREDAVPAREPAP